MNFDVTSIVTAVAGIVIGIVAGLYVGFKKAAKADGVADWKDTVVAEVDELATKLEQPTE